MFSLFGKFFYQSEVNLVIGYFDLKESGDGQQKIDQFGFIWEKYGTENNKASFLDRESLVIAQSPFSVETGADREIACGMIFNHLARKDVGALTKMEERVKQLSFIPRGKEGVPLDLDLEIHEISNFFVEREHLRLLRSLFD